MSMKAVELRHVSKQYGQRVIFADISFAVEEGELVALTGPSGCGKSTLLNMIGVLESYNQGAIHLFEKPLPKIESFAATKIRRDVINYLFQSFALINDRTILHNLLLAMRFLNLEDRKKKARAEQVLEEVGLLPLKNALVNTLSGGEQQRTAVARAMLKPGKLVLADEPTGSLDVQAAETSFGLIQRLCRHHHKTVLMVTHSPELAQRADRVIELTAFGG